MGCRALDSEYYGSLARKGFRFLPNGGRPRTVKTKILGKPVNKHRRPAAERIALRQGVREPACPEA